MALSIPRDVLALIVKKNPFTEQYTLAKALFPKGTSHLEKFTKDKEFIERLGQDLVSDMVVTVMTPIYSLPDDFAHDTAVFHKIPLWQELYKSGCVGHYSVSFKKVLRKEGNNGEDDIVTEMTLTVTTTDTECVIEMAVDSFTDDSYAYFIYRGRRCLRIKTSADLADLFVLPPGEPARIDNNGPEMKSMDWDDDNYVLFPAGDSIPPECQCVGWSKEELSELLF